jgi:hypothetical protein
MGRRCLGGGKKQVIKDTGHIWQRRPCLLEDFLVKKEVLDAKLDLMCRSREIDEERVEIYVQKLIGTDELVLS